jgi:asparagine synthase (glutamine-hydrolysing)
MVQALRRRGPDSEGIESWPGAVLGHRRLSILDLSEAGRQPMLSRDGNTGLVFNGCVYNFQELRAELEKSGREFRSHTDTEVLLEGYAEWGVEKLVARCRGMFAFGLWDEREQKLVLVRDRLGVKPLFYAERNGEIAFASTAEALYKSGFTDGLDPEAVLEYLEFGWVSDGKCIYDGVKKVAAAGIVQWQGGKTIESVYWNLPEPGSNGMDFEEALKETERLLMESVKLRLIADVPVGSLLSGGIDSALIAWALRELNAKVKCYTVGTPGHPADESGAAAETAALLGLELETVELSADETPELNELTEAYGEPFACSSALGMLKVCRAAKEKATVLLTGDGGDDVYLGYGHHRNFLRAQNLARMLPIGSGQAWPMLRGAFGTKGPLRRAKHLMDYATGGLGAITRTHDGLPYYQRAGMLGPKLKGLRLWHREIELSAESGRRVLEDFLVYERRTRFVAEYMTKVDGAAMRYAIEARSPFLDQKIWELAGGLPVEMRLRNGELKSILREFVRRRLGPEVAGRRKRGFTIPVGDWLIRGAWRGELEALGEKSELARQGWIDGAAMKAAAAKAMAAGKAPVQFWTLVVLEKWLAAKAS